MDKLTALKQYFGHDSFRQGQEALIDALLSGRDVLGVMPTGAGKSVCYQIPALLFSGVTVVISPLISLMKDQVAALTGAGISAAFLNSSLTAQESRRVLLNAAKSQYRILYLAPERLDSPAFLKLVRSIRISLVAVDEAHCISQWGQDFRPSYLHIRDFLDTLSPRPPVGAFTATATGEVREDIVSSLGLKEPLGITTGFDRPNLYFSVERTKAKYEALTAFLRQHPGQSGIVYCATRRTVEQVCQKLCRDGYAAARYHAGLTERERRTSQEDFRFDRKTVMVATNAFGMGIDKSNVSFVVHYNMPKNLESYYQEAGRAGRDGETAHCLLLYARQDVATAKWLISHSADRADLSQADREQLRARELEKLDRMTAYAITGKCLRATILRYFGEAAPLSCHHCSNCARPAAQAVPGQSQGTRAKRQFMEDALFLQLKKLRSDIANEKNIPAYLVFSDLTLRDMSRKRPQSDAAFMGVTGVGQVKHALYGERFLEHIRRFTGAEEPKAGPAEPAAAALPGVAQRNEGAPWSGTEEERLRHEFGSGMSLREIRDRHGRTLTAVLDKLKRLGLSD